MSTEPTQPTTADTPEVLPFCDAWNIMTLEEAKQTEPGQQMFGQQTDPAEPKRYTQRDWQFWALVPVLVILFAAGAVYQFGANIRAKLS